MFNITFDDGTILDNLNTNASYFLTDQPVDKAFFEGKLNHITVGGELDDEEGSMPLEPGEYGHCELVSTLRIDGKYGFCIREIPPDKFAISKLNADIQYLAMMTDNAF